MLKIVGLTILGLLLVFIIVFIYSCCVISSRISREEEQYESKRMDRI